MNGKNDVARDPLVGSDKISKRPLGANPSTNFKSWVHAILLGLAVLLCFARSLSGGFIWNDSEYVTRPELRSLAGLVRIWTEPGATEQYYPLLHSAFWVQHRLWGDNPWWYHFLTVMLHAGAALLFARLLLCLEAPGAWLAALLFALHPVHVESVAWITEQKNTLSLVFYLLAALAYLRFDATRGRGAYLAGFALFALSLLCKTVTATLPAALLVVLWWKRGRLEWRRDLKPLLPWLLLGAAAGLFASWVERHYVGAEGADFTASGTGRLLVAARAIWFYLRQLFWPFGLNFIYPRWTVDATVWWQWLFVFAAFLLTVVFWLMRRRFRAFLAAWLFFLGSLFPVLGFVNLYGARYSFVWDHWQYLADLGPLAMVAGGLIFFSDRLAPRWHGAETVLMALFAVVLGSISWHHSGIFHDDETLYRATLARNPECWLAENNLAFLLTNRPGGLPEALVHYERALRIKPDYAEAEVNFANALAKIPGRLADAEAHYAHAARSGSYAEAWYNLGNLLALQPARREDAVDAFTRALQLKPEFAEAHVNLANVLATTPGQIPAALTHYEEALRLDPLFLEAHYNLAALLATLPGRESDAITHYETVIRLKPDFAEAQVRLANVLARTPDRRAAALAHYEQALQLQPRSAETHFALANLLSGMSGRLTDAETHYQEALRIDPNFVPAWNNLGILQARQQQFDDARKSWEKALELDPSFADARRNLDLLRQMQRR
jgi:protein O-mannosyl-transferase